MSHSVDVGWLRFARQPTPCPSLSGRGATMASGDQQEIHMKWFGRKSARDAVRPVLTRAGFATSFGEWPRSYEAQVREGYCQNPVAQRAVKLVAEGVGSAALVGSDPALVALV